MGKARVAQKEARERLCVEEVQTPRELFWQAIRCWGWICSLSLLGLPSFTVNPWGPVKPDILGDVVYYSIY